MVALTQVRLERRKKISIADTRRGDVGTITGIIGLTVKEGKYSDPAVHSQGDCRVTQDNTTDLCYEDLENTLRKLGWK